ncbi:RagB/SusD family nutrient uptake outer membrane protein [Flavobacteriaceae bacterium TP-CH-4]|uniref:RagB/SusD family nutrient uptake outer membrane protein n=1 Tax=Pelagihabitans pacificus TaxID=2696054 RepID=A0A967AUK3_9FLAO|nr:RagB/SusD family nutrient uptake outer membrane protein [Pelagihabitans pacificus]NHF60659.1 RagB/SusD family nutrient uptake outer membrane protein [Pelagihabitans pacificus]
MKRFFKLALVSTALITFSCTDLDDPLEDTLTEEFSVDGVSTGGGGSDGPLLATFGRLRAGSATNNGFFASQGVPGDDMAVPQKGGDWFDGGVWIQLHRHTWDAAHPQIENAWNDAYGGIGECNIALDGGSLDANQTAQVRALRAYFYWRLLDLFGRVKIITSPGGDAPQSERTAVFDFVESELLATLGISAVTASMDLSGSDLNTEISNYRINQYAALGILAKLYLNAEVYTGTPRYQEADWAATYIIDNSPYQLCAEGCVEPNLAKRPDVESDPAELEGYAAIFAPTNQNNPEIIFAIEYASIGAGGMNFAQMTLHGPSQLTFGLDAAPWNGFVTLEEFYNSYEDGDLRKEANFLVGPQTDFSGNPLIDFAADDDDLQVVYTPAINELEPNALRQGGARLKKFSFEVLGRQDMNNDYPIVRLGDVHLIRGEARARAAGDWNLSLPDVNAIRARAGLTTALGTITADEFLAERGREMHMESSRRTDLIRFGKFQDSWWEKTNADSFKNLMPIPVEQINASDGTLTQNPGY